MSKDAEKKIKGLENESGITELGLDDLDNVDGGIGYGIGINSKERVDAFCGVVDVLIISGGIEEAVKFVSKYFPSPDIIAELRKNGTKGLGEILIDGMNDPAEKIGNKIKDISKIV